MKLTTICKRQHMLRSSGDTQLSRVVKEPQGNILTPLNGQQDKAQPQCVCAGQESDATVHIMDNMICASTCPRWAAAALMTSAAVCLYARSPPRPWNLLQSAIDTDGSNWSLTDLPGYLAAKIKHSPQQGRSQGDDWLMLPPKRRSMMMLL